MKTIDGRLRVLPSSTQNVFLYMKQTHCVFIIDLKRCSSSTRWRPQRNFREDLSGEITALIADPLPLMRPHAIALNAGTTAYAGRAAQGHHDDDGGYKQLHSGNHVLYPAGKFTLFP